MSHNTRRQLLRQPRREAWVDVNLDALEHNARVLQKQLTDTLDLMAVLKADAYGHGVALTLPVLEGWGITHVAVASVDEALEIRNNSASVNILVLGPTPDWALDVARTHRITLAIADAHQLPLMADNIKKTTIPLQVHIKVDTGMHRVGIALDEAIPFITQCLQTPGLCVDGLFSHLANGANATITQPQLAAWTAVIDAVDSWCDQHQVMKPRHRHLMNTPGWFAREESSLNPKYHTLVRTGMALWGYGWLNGVSPLRPVMGLKGRITHLQHVPAGEGISYGPTYRTSTVRRIATLPCGYADGVPRGLSNQITGMCQGVPVQQVGTITMDQMMWDVTEVPNVTVGSVITMLDTLVSNSCNLTAWAQILNTIEYELMCGLRVRLPKTYSRD
jgi:alanine racemase